MKKEVCQSILETLEQKIKTVKQSVSFIQEARNNETKSSAGDKFETHRAMMHLQMETFIKRKEVAEDLYSILQRIASAKVLNQQIGLGSLVELERGWYYISVSAPKFIYQNLQYTVISREAPFYKQLQGKEVGDFVEWYNLNGDEDWIEILSIH